MRPLSLASEYHSLDPLQRNHNLSTSATLTFGHVWIVGLNLLNSGQLVGSDRCGCCNSDVDGFAETGNLELVHRVLGGKCFLIFLGFLCWHTFEEGPSCADVEAGALLVGNLHLHGHTCCGETDLVVVAVWLKLELNESS